MKRLQDLEVKLQELGPSLDYSAFDSDEEFFDLAALRVKKIDDLMKVIVGHFLESEVSCGDLIHSMGKALDFHVDRKPQDSNRNRVWRKIVDDFVSSADLADLADGVVRPDDLTTNLVDRICGKESPE